MHIAYITIMVNIQTWSGKTLKDGTPVINVDANRQSYMRIVAPAGKTQGLEVGDIVLLTDVSGDPEDKWLAKLVQKDELRAYFTFISDLETKNCCENCGAVQN